ncbi:MAG: hypothetical protein Q9195_003934 [Heterodermia aff. obscurata]
MFDGNPYKRVRCLSLAQYADASLRDPAFMMTLPFDQNRIARYMTDNVLARVRQRWEWYSKAQKVNAALGTLAYLPAEVRLFIWQSLLQCNDSKSLDGQWEYDRGLGSPFRLSSFYFGFGRRGLFLDSVENVRLVSSQIKAEYDHVFLYMRTFRFNYTENLFAFLHRLNDVHQEQLSSVELCVYTRLSMEPWLDSIAYLPVELKHVHFRLQVTPPHWYHEQRGLESLEHLGRLVEQAARKAPRAQISIGNVNDQPLDPICQAAVDGILARIRAMERNIPCMGRL